jgi:hypothetical protein
MAGRPAACHAVSQVRPGERAGRSVIKRGFAASREQRAKVRNETCACCGIGTQCDPAHLTARSQGGCDHPDCVIALCRLCHRAFDERGMSLESVIAMPRYAAERAHMAGHMSFARCIARLNPALRSAA